MANSAQSRHSGKAPFQRPRERSGGRPEGPRRGPQPPAAVVTAPGAEATSKTAQQPSEVEIPETITVRDLAEKIGRSPIEVIKVLMNYGVMAAINQTIDFDTATIVGSELGVEIKPIEVETPAPPAAETVAAGPKTIWQRVMQTERPEDLRPRPPVVTVLGHVDHGKTTLLDAIRHTRVVEGEAGGITQHIGAYQVELQGRKITFLDTPGHEAFTAMRARGAQVTDIVVLVVAADDGVMPQTREALDHARAAGVPIIVALTKVDKPTANVERVKQQLVELGLVPEEWGGNTIVVPVAAKIGKGVEDLLENILLVTEIEGFKANPDRPAVGTVIESSLDRSRGPIATLLVQNGTLRVGDYLVIGEVWGRVRAMYDDRGKTIKSAPPATPARVIGLSDVPIAGEIFEVVSDERTARAKAAQRAEERRQREMRPVAKVVSLEDIFQQIRSGHTKELNLILKADVQGSLEPIVTSLEQLNKDHEEVQLRILHQGLGNISESDVMLAVASKAIIVGFNVGVDAAAQRLAESNGVEIRRYNVIYELIEEIDKALHGMLEPKYREVIIGHAEVRQVFTLSRGKVAGCYVTDGLVARNATVRVRRNGATVHEGRVASLKRFKDDVTEVRQGFECGIALEGFQDFQVGDILEFCRTERVTEPA
ncbi:MAG: translation initiation factor IF-2 [Anaerolineae bacterium]|nr:translation initiation factor IF-2 [Anaerolineae bacterium]MDW8100324.1 translation initiation factor IF-2 [Anaerolineae bacterium]